MGRPKQTATEQDLPVGLVAEMRRLTGCGFKLVPLGHGADGKSPLCAFLEQPPGLRQTLGLMKAHGSLVYGILLDGFVVADADEMTPRTEDAIATRLGQTPVQVATPRGRHFWYRDIGGPLPQLRSEGLLVDLKRGAGQYVVGPGSVRPDGGEYIAITGRLGQTFLPTIRSPLRAREPEKRVPIGRRHDFLLKKAREYAETALSEREIAENVTYDRDLRCEIGDDPMPDAEVLNLAAWAWSRRTTPGRLYEGRRSRFSVEREVMDTLLPLASGAEAFALYAVLTSAHGHVPGKRFAVDFEGMKRAGLIAFGRDRFRQARQLLTTFGLLRPVGTYVPGKQCQQFQLGRLTVDDNASALPAPVTPIPPGGEVS